MYLATNGSPATFYVMDAETLEIRFQQKKPHNEDAVWVVTTAPDGNVYNL
ncbi:hypothetical protein ACFO25_06485 [Paenactinomyces guangxiensis]|uniref:Uncharacterized protein n=1 Tax=Paenactinomyces guangxiensis TaxID=1490290 RepID=A0A7W1WNS1_9BACL|nr:hypothetical protein [Paenactinomyces guangxiensis]MBA4493298.1 hypothetical protein [Paenactinomyces guangxiensis]MBH8589851.1 hypothetical protein [Paenactinomyces guangxiensis]